MKKQLSLLASFLITLAAFSQGKLEKEAAANLEEGKRLYRSEMASWYGTDIFLAKFKDRSENIGGYFSYTEKDSSTCIFFSKDDAPYVIGAITFDSTYNVKTAIADGKERRFNEAELELYAIRQKALDEINSGDTLFKVYDKTNLNLIPLISNGEKKVYVLTGPQENGVMIFGNDYLLTFDKSNKLKSKRILHEGVFFTNYSTGKETEETSVGGIHTHIPSTGEFITPTDICTLMLYGKFAGWDQYYVMSEKFVSIWSCKTNQLATITRKAFDAIYKDQEKRNKE